MIENWRVAILTLLAILALLTFVFIIFMVRLRSPQVLRLRSGTVNKVEPSGQVAHHEHDSYAYALIRVCSPINWGHISFTIKVVAILLFAVGR
jgi:hypothetical protein